MPRTTSPEAVNIIAPAEMPKPLFAIGDQVWCASTQSSAENHQCPDCQGSAKWRAVSPTGTEVDIECPRCLGRGSLSLYSSAPYVRKLTIGQVTVRWPRGRGWLHAGGM